MVSSGWHFVNRLGYVITETPVPSGLTVDVYDAEEFEEWKERCDIADALGPEFPESQDEMPSGGHR